MRKTLVVTIDLEGAALAEDFGDYEAERILEEAKRATRTLFTLAEEGGDHWEVGTTRPLLDVNGNTVGRVGVVESEERL
jgi:hypothetical protein